MKPQQSSYAFVLAFVLALSLFVTACGPAQPLTRPLYSGSDGIKLSFPQANAVQQFQNDTFTVSVRLENDGAASITPLNPGFVIASFDPAILALETTTVSANPGERPALQTATSEAGCLPRDGVQPSATCIAFAARGRTHFTPVGDVAFAEFSFTTKPLGDSRQRASTPLTIQACYPYTTTFIANICVDNDFRSNPSSSCNAISLQAQPQGAPIAVTSVTPRYTRTGSGISARYEITLRNLHNGLVLAPSAPSVQACNLENLARSEYGVIRVAANLSTIPLTCGFDGTSTVRLVRGEATILCSYDGPSLPIGVTESANYEAPLIVTAEYYYIQRLTTQVEVTK